MSSSRTRATGGRPTGGRPTGGRPTGARRARPLPKGDSLFTPDASPARQTVEQKSATSLLWLHQLPVWFLPLLAVALLVAGFAIPGWGGGAALLVLAVVLGWLAVISWPRLNAQARLLRTAAIAVVVIAAILRGLS